VFAAKRTDFQDRGYEGAPVLGTVVVQQAQTGKVRKAAPGPSDPENPLEGVGNYLIAASRKKASVQVKLT
ncbi:unnamed protein product, partial [marine sediment metagenome]